MAIPLNDSVRIQGNKPADDKYLKNGSRYANEAEVKSSIIPTDRVIGQLVVVTKNGKSELQWFKDGVEDADLVPFGKQFISVREITADGAISLENNCNVNVAYYGGNTLRNATLPPPTAHAGKELIAYNQGTAILRIHSHDSSPTIVDVNKQDSVPFVAIRAGGYGRLISTGTKWVFFAVNDFSTIAEEGKTVVLTVLPDGSPQAEEIMELWVYDDTLTGYDLAGLQAAYPTSAGYMQGFEVRCRLMTPPTTYRKESENDSRWIKIEGSNVT